MDPALACRMLLVLKGLINGEARADEEGTRYDCSRVFVMCDPAKGVGRSTIHPLEAVQYLVIFAWPRSGFGIILRAKTGEGGGV